MKKFFKILVEIIIGLVVLGAAVMVYNSGKKEKAANKTQAAGAVPVVVQRVAERLTHDRVEALGRGVARESILVTASESEKITDVFFNDGDAVRAGQLLVQLEERLLQAEREIALATLADERREMERARELLGKDGIARKVVEGRETSLAKAELALAAIDTRLDMRKVRAPFAGVLGLRQVSLGAYVSPGTVLTTLDDISELHVDFSVPERYLGMLATGLVFRARTSAFPEEVLEGRITHVEARIDAASLSAMARGTLANADGRLRPGMLFSVWLEALPRMSMWVPEKVMVSLGEKQFVFVASDGRVTRREVKLGRREVGMVEVREGLTAEEWVVTDGVGKLRDGAQVEVTHGGAE